MSSKSDPGPEFDTPSTDGTSDVAPPPRASQNPAEYVAVPTTGFLLAVSGTAHGRVFRLDRDPTVLGSAADAHVHLDGDGVARYHVQIRREPPNHVIETLEGRGATFVNGTPVERRTLVPGDRLQVGEHARLKYLSRLGDGLEHPASPARELPSGVNGGITRSGIKVRSATED
ncbi:MAG: FHA domain-containing protein [Polyangiaceae bacterium]